MNSISPITPQVRFGAKKQQMKPAVAVRPSQSQVQFGGLSQSKKGLLASAAFLLAAIGITLPGGTAHAVSSASRTPAVTRQAQSETGIGVDRLIQLLKATNNEQVFDGGIDKPELDNAYAQANHGELNALGTLAYHIDPSQEGTHPDKTYSESDFRTLAGDDAVISKEEADNAPDKLGWTITKLYMPLILLENAKGITPSGLVSEIEKTVPHASADGLYQSAELQQTINRLLAEGKSREDKDIVVLENLDDQLRTYVGDGANIGYTRANLDTLAAHGEDGVITPDVAKRAAVILGWAASGDV